MPATADGDAQIDGLQRHTGIANSLDARKFYLYRQPFAETGLVPSLILKARKPRKISLRAKLLASWLLNFPV